MRKTAFLLSVAVGVGSFCFAGGVFADDAVIASRYSDRYHLPSCKIVEKISPEEKIVFRSPEEAVKAGFGPCKKCHPLSIQNNFGKKDRSPG